MLKAAGSSPSHQGPLSAPGSWEAPGLDRKGMSGGNQTGKHLLAPPPPPQCFLSCARFFFCMAGALVTQPRPRCWLPQLLPNSSGLSPGALQGTSGCLPSLLGGPPISRQGSPRHPVHMSRCPPAPPIASRPGHPGPPSPPAPHRLPPQSPAPPSSPAPVTRAPHHHLLPIASRPSDR